MKKLIPLLFIALLSCEHQTPLQEITTDQYDYDHLIFVDSLVLLADEAVNTVQHNLIEKDNTINSKKITIEDQIKEIERQKREVLKMHNKAEEEKLKAIEAKKQAQKDIAYADTLYAHLQIEMDRQWAEYDKTIEYLDMELFTIGKELEKVVEDIAIVCIENGLTDKLTDPTTKLNNLVSYLPQERIDSLITNTPVLYKVEKRKINQTKKKTRR